MTVPVRPSSSCRRPRQLSSFRSRQFAKQLNLSMETSLSEYAWLLTSGLVPSTSLNVSREVLRLSKVSHIISDLVLKLDSRVNCCRRIEHSPCEGRASYTRCILVSADSLREQSHWPFACILASPKAWRWLALLWVCIVHERVTATMD